MLDQGSPGTIDMHTPVYTIGVVADLLGVSVPTIRKYEECHFILPDRTPSGHRRYSQVDLEILRCIRIMIDEFGLSTNGVARLLALIPCWEFIGCSEENRQQCDAYYNDNLPCWAAQTKQDICKDEECRQCPVYDRARNLSQLKEMFKSMH